MILPRRRDLPCWKQVSSHRNGFSSWQNDFSVAKRFFAVAKQFFRGETVFCHGKTNFPIFFFRLEFFASAKQFCRGEMIFRHGETVFLRKIVALVRFHELCQWFLHLFLKWWHSNPWFLVSDHDLVSEQRSCSLLSCFWTKVWFLDSWFDTCFYSCFSRTQNDIFLPCWPPRACFSFSFLFLKDSCLDSSLLVLMGNIFLGFPNYTWPPRLASYILNLGFQLSF